MVMMAAMNSTMPETKDEHYPYRRNWVSNLRVEFLSQFDEREFEVAEILLNLPYLVTNSLSDFRFSYSWGSKCRRSALDNPPSLPRRRKVVVSPTSPPPPLPLTPAVHSVPKAEATSPATPLAFCPSDSETKSKQSTKNKNTSVKRVSNATCFLQLFLYFFCFVFLLVSLISGFLGFCSDLIALGVVFISFNFFLGFLF